MNFLDHINGKKHIQNLGMSMKLKRSTVDDVKARFEFLKNKRAEAKKEYSLSERLQDAKEEEEKMAAYSSQVKNWFQTMLVLVNFIRYAKIAKRENAKKTKKTEGKI